MEFRLLSRKYSKTEPFSSLVPLLVTTLSVPPLARPESARKRWVSKLNSPMESSGKFCTMPPTVSSLLSPPSIR